jgi:hypothetical protein
VVRTYPFVGSTLRDRVEPRNVAPRSTIAKNNAAKETSPAELLKRSTEELGWFHSMNDPDWLARAIAIGSAVASAGSLIIAMMTYRRGGPRISLLFDDVEIAPPYDNLPTTQDRSVTVKATAINKGATEILVESFFLELIALDVRTSDEETVWRIGPWDSFNPCIVGGFRNRQLYISTTIAPSIPSKCRLKLRGWIYLSNGRRVRTRYSYIVRPGTILHRVRWALRDVIGW